MTKPYHLTGTKALRSWSFSMQGELVLRQRGVACVYEVRGIARPCFLRVSPLTWRNHEAVQCELSFLTHLHRNGCSLALPIPTGSGASCVEIDNNIAVLFEAAPGRLVEPGDLDWKEAAMHAWGRALARQHSAASDFVPSCQSWRDDWRFEPVFCEGLAILRPTDPDVMKVADRLLEGFVESANHFGPISFVHADFAPQNFRYDENGALTAFDFDNCVKHWVGYDLAIAISVLARRDEPEVLIERLLEGYVEIVPLPCSREALGELLKLRGLYVLCDRVCAVHRGDAVDSMALPRARARFFEVASTNWFDGPIAQVWDAKFHHVAS